MIDQGGRLKQTSIDSLAKTFHSLTYSHPDYDSSTHGGPMIAIIFTNFSKNYEEEDDPMIPGVEASAYESNHLVYKKLIENVRK